MRIRPVTVTLLVVAAVMLAAPAGAGAMGMNHWSVAPWWDCGQVVDGSATTLECEARATRELGGSGRESQILLPVYTTTVNQTDAIQDARLHLHVVAPEVFPAAERVVVYRVNDHWDPDQPTANATWDSVPVAAGAPDADGDINVDVTEQVDDWRRYHASLTTEGTPNYGFLVRAECEGQPIAGCPVVELGALHSPDPGLRPALEVTSWPWINSSKIVAPDPGVMSTGEVPLAVDSIYGASDFQSVKYQYRAGNLSHWTDVPLAALRDAEDGSPLSSLVIPVHQGRSDGVMWNVAASPGGEVDGLVRVRALAEHIYPEFSGVTSEVAFVLDHDGIPNPPAVVVPPEEPAPPSRQPASAPPPTIPSRPSSTTTTGLRSAPRRAARAHRHRPVHHKPAARCHRKRARRAAAKRHRCHSAKRHPHRHARAR